MFDLNYSGSTDDDQRYVVWLMQLFQQARTMRVNFEVQWEEAAALCWPEYRNSFAFGHNRPPGVKYTEFQVDSTGSIASQRFMAICDAMLTPHTMLWSRIAASDKSLMRRQEVKQYYDDVTNTLWRYRYRPEANFMASNQINWQALGVFGNMGMFIEEMDMRPGQVFTRGPRYIPTSPGQMYILENHQGRVDGFIRHLRMNARQMYQRWGDKISVPVKGALEKNSPTYFDVLHFCLPNTEYDPVAIFSRQSKPWISVYVSVQGYDIMEKGGYRSFPWAPGRYMQAPEEIYARGPAQMVLPELKTLNAEKAMFLKVGHRAADPAYLIGDDGLMDLKTQPGAFNFGGWNEKGKMVVGILPSGEIPVSQEMLEASKQVVDSAFLIDLWPLLNKDAKNEEQDARGFIEDANQRGVFLGPTLARQYGEYIGGMIDRELDVLSYLRLLPPVPDALKEAQGEYSTIYCSPLAKALENQGIAGYMRTVEFARDVVEITGDPSIMDRFDFDISLPEIGEEQYAPSRWFASDQKVAQRGAMRKQEAERDRQVKELPGRAAMAKAQAIVTKAQTGGNTGGTLSGTPEGGMPMMPGQSTPGGRAFGQPGPQ